MQNEYSFLLLAGGKSSRMGTDKGKLCYKGSTFAETQLQKARAVGLGQCFFSGKGEGITEAVTVQDQYPECGPMGGIHACLQKMTTPYFLMLTVDVPQLPQEVLTALLQEHRRLLEEGERCHALILRHNGREEPLIGVFAADLLPLIERNLMAGKYSLYTVLNEVGYRVLDLPLEDWQAESINTPAAYEALLQREQNK